MFCVANGSRQFIWPFRTKYNRGYNAKQERSAVYGGLQTHKYKILNLVNTISGSSSYGKVVRTVRSGLEAELAGQQSMSGPPGSLNYVCRLELHEWVLVHLILNVESWLRSIMGPRLLFVVCIKTRGTY